MGILGHWVGLAGTLAPIVIGELVDDPAKRWKVIRLASEGTSIAYEAVHTINELARRREQVAKLAPYAKRLDVHRTLQSEDHIFETQHGSASMVSLTRLEKGSDAGGFLATVTLAVDPEATPSPVGGFGPR